MTAAAAATTPTLPDSIKWAAWVAFTYAAVVTVHTMLPQALNQSLDTRDSLRGLLRAALFFMTGLGLLRRARWAWSLGLGLSFLYLAVAGIDFGLWLVFRIRWWDSMLPSMVAPVAAVAASLLAALVVLLVHPRTRAAIRAAAV